MTPQQRIDRLESAIRALQIEYEKFWNGARDVPPADLADELRAEIRALRNLNLRGVADNFRLQQLEARFASTSELANRRLRQREEGRGPRPVVERRPAHDPRAGVVVGDRLEPAAVEALYAGLARGTPAGPGFDLERFRAYLERQLETIRARTGCRQVRFRLEPDGERLKLKAKPL
ncbi:MAG TPA: hypothetical protein VHM02_00370 [Thermoanaerobaculia bacterium]|nr:hypothetical protein [Thermoanaerobaculia bacterium]